MVYPHKFVKYTKAEVGYKPKAKKYLCKNCHWYWFKAVANKCEIVAGKINPHGSCDYWRRKNK